MQLSDCCASFHNQKSHLLSYGVLYRRSTTPPKFGFPCDDAHKFRIIEDVKERCANRGLKIVDIDGVRVSNGDGWWLLRASNTQNVLVARAESADAGGLDRLKLEILEQLSASGIPREQLPDALLPKDLSS